MVLESGFAGASHRLVAQRAGLPLASTTYYFTSLDDLLAEALGDLSARWSAAARAALDRAPARVSTRHFAALVLDLVAPAPSGGDDLATTLLYERYLEAARHGHLRPLVRTFDRDLDALVLVLLGRSELPPTVAFARVVVAVADGALVRSLAEGTGRAAARRTVRTFLDLVSADARP